jgi:hypothetical protein
MGFQSERKRIRNKRHKIIIGIRKRKKEIRYIDDKTIRRIRRSRIIKEND